MRVFCALFVLIFNLAGFARDDPRRVLFEVDDMYTLKLTISHLYHGFAYGNSQEVLSRIADSYEEDHQVYNYESYSSRVNDILSQKNSITGESELDLKLFCEPSKFDLKDNKAEVSFTLTTYIPSDNGYYVKRQDCILYLSKIGSGWQVYKSDNWLSSLKDLFTAPPLGEGNLLLKE